MCRLAQGTQTVFLKLTDAEHVFTPQLTDSWYRLTDEMRHFTQRCLPLYFHTLYFLPPRDSVKQQIGQWLRAIGLMAAADRLRYRLAKRAMAKRNELFLRQHEDLAFPPPYFIYETFRLDYERYFDSGREDAEWVADKARPFLTLQNIDVLDWGCGPGRIIRHMPAVLGGSSRCHGSDYNEAYIRWCAENLAGIDFRRNGLMPPLPFDAASMDLVYSISIFTHLSKNAHEAWMIEMHRVLRPGGLFLTTTHGDATMVNLTATELETYQRGELVERAQVKEGHRMYAAYQPPAFMRRLVEGRFEVCKHEPGKQENWGIGQDLWVLRRL